MESDEITPERRAALLGRALHAVAWELVEYETDTADRGVSQEHYQDALERAQALLPTLMPTRADQGTEEPEWGIAHVKTPDTIWTISEEGARETAAAEPGQWLIYSRPKTVTHEWTNVAQETRAATPHMDWCHTVTGCQESDHCTCDHLDTSCGYIESGTPDG